ncbi:MAG: PDC sensor domain-containing protein [Spirochaetes bacterium]|nr:PDC sensor domain-containing protein [Spirochaetota bacterium]
MKQNKFIKVVSKISAVFLGILVVLFLLNLSGLFYFLYKSNYNKANLTIKELFIQFMEEGGRVVESVSEDPIIKSSIMQYHLGENILPVLKVLSMYKKNYQQIKNIGIFDSHYNFITSDIESLSASRQVPVEWFVSSQNKKLYLSPIYFHREFNQYIVSFITPLKNVIDETVGFIKLDISIKPLLEEMEKYTDITIMVINGSENRINFVYPLDANISDLKSVDLPVIEVKTFTPLDLPGFKLSYGVRIPEPDITLMTAATSRFFEFPLFFKLFLLFTAVVFILSYGYLWFEKRQEIILDKKKKFKNLINDIVNISKKAERDNMILIENIPTAEQIEESQSKEGSDDKTYKKKADLEDDFKILE